MGFAPPHFSPRAVVTVPNQFGLPFTPVTQSIAVPAPTPVAPIHPRMPVPWTVEQCHAVPAEWLPSIQGRVQFLEGVTSVHTALDQLNKGYIACPQGICAVYSRRQGAHYILYRPEAAPYAHQLWPLTSGRPRSMSRPRSASLARSMSRPRSGTPRGRPDTPIRLRPVALSHSQSRASSIGRSPVASPSHAAALMQQPSWKMQPQVPMQPVIAAPEVTPVSAESSKLELPIPKRQHSGISGVERTHSGVSKHASFDYEPPRSRPTSPRQQHSGLPDPFAHSSPRGRRH